MKKLVGLFTDKEFTLEQLNLHLGGKMKNTLIVVEVFKKFDLIDEIETRNGKRWFKPTGKKILIDDKITDKHHAKL